MKRIKNLLTVAVTATLLAISLSSCFGWYDWMDEPGPPPPPHHHRHHAPPPPPPPHRHYGYHY